MRDRARWQGIKDLLATDLYSLFIWLGGVGVMMFGGAMIFQGLTS
jgi:hypothetical protein